MIHNSDVLKWKVMPVTGTIGAEISEIDLRYLDDGQFDQLRNLWREYLVLFFPAQSLTPDALVNLAKRFGETEIHPFLDKLTGYPEVVVLDSEAGKADMWHTDVTFSRTPPMASVLQLQRGPAVGGDTIWTNQYLAFETLSPVMQTLLRGLSSVHSAAVFGRAEMTEEHPVVRVHPETGRESLFVNRLFTSHISQFRRSESDALLEYLYNWSEQPRFQCRFRWREGSIAIWDNRCTQHFAVDDYDSSRTLHRVTVVGDRPYGASQLGEAFTETRTGISAQAEDNFETVSAFEVDPGNNAFATTP